jgi:hypothetical protein
MAGDSDVARPRFVNVHAPEAATIARENTPWCDTRRAVGASKSLGSEARNIQRAVSRSPPRPIRVAVDLPARSRLGLSSKLAFRSSRHGSDLYEKTAERASGNG